MKLRPISMLFAAIALAWPLVCQAAPGVGAKYDARDPRPCPPSSGALSVALATSLVICNNEHEFSRSLFLVDNVKVQIGGSRPYEPRADGTLSDIDVRQPVYPIRGSFISYMCDVPRAASGGAYAWPSTFGKNCGVYENPHATGTCWKSTFGDWNCIMKDYNSGTTPTKKGVPPPH